MLAQDSLYDGGKALDGPLHCGATVLIVGGDANKVLPEQTEDEAECPPEDWKGRNGRLIEECRKS
jgi:hypothetical protein